MKYDTIFHLSLLQIQIFLRCYEDRNYTQIAYEYNYTPSAISKSIHTMEELLGYKLFIKDKKELQPTVEADILAAEWAELTGKVITGLEKAEKVHKQISGGVRLGIISDSEFCRLYLEDRLETNAPAELREQIIWGRKDMRELLALLNEDVFDIVVSTSRIMSNCGFQLNHVKKVFASPDAVFIPYGHPLFEKQIHSFADFKEYPFLLLDPALYPENYQLLFDLAKKHDFVPKIATICNNTEAARDNLYFGKGLYIANSLSSSDWQNESLRKVELVNEPYTEVVAVWKKNNTRAEVLQVVDAITR